jgi:hypothetical protein
VRGAEFSDRPAGLGLLCSAVPVARVPISRGAPVTCFHGTAGPGSAVTTRPRASFFAIVLKCLGEVQMASPKRASKRIRRSKAVPVLGAAGLLSMAGAASASTSGPAADVTPQKVSPNHEIFLGEEEISDVNLSTFYVFDNENTATPQLGEKVAYVVGRCGCRGCRCGYRCRCGWRGCAGCGGCGGCCLRWGRCRVC